MILNALGLLLAGAVALVPHTAAAGPADRTVRALESIAAKGSARAQFELAAIYENTRGPARSARRALRYYCKAARQDHVTAAYHAGRMLLNGSGATKNEELGRAWLRRAAALGSTAAAGVVGKVASAPRPTQCAPYTGSAGGIRMPPAEVKAIVHRLAPTYRLDPDLVLAVIAVESGYRPGAVSSKNAMGLMQLIPATAARFGVKDPFNPEENIRGGMKYLRWLLAYFKGDVTLALAGYNAGENAVLRHGGVPPYRETQDYVVKVARLYAGTRHPYDATVVAAAALVSTRTPRGGREEVPELSRAAVGGRAFQVKSASMDD
ncbi:lytic transglycosylase domain-containing protein [Azospirillum halopraeferens]|uniref:lytic transglycosylase domain-containing protein n=1 Tax=Azospirillum halopraeferens TaxID=34010 RepID=UPI0004193D15|nr:transglycosylase SLT domain-containing protein [Azospirillum halopraeferens]